MVCGVDPVQGKNRNKAIGPLKPIIVSSDYDINKLIDITIINNK